MAAFERHFKVPRLLHCFLLIVFFMMVIVISMVWWTSLEKRNTIADDDQHSSFAEVKPIYEDEDNLKQPKLPRSDGIHSSVNNDPPINDDTQHLKQYKLPHPDCSKKLLIYHCSTESGGCSGLGDRERGIVSSFLLALLTNRTFVINFTRPCPLSNFFEPNIYNWSACLTSVQTQLDDLLLVGKDEMNGTMSTLPDLSTLGKGDIWNERYVVIRLNTVLNRPNGPLTKHPSVNETIPWLRLGSTDYTSHLVFDALLKLTPSLENEINEFIQEVTGNGAKRLIAFHARREFITEQDIPRIFDTMKLYSNTSKYAIYFASENKELRERAKAMFPECVTLNVSGIITHVDNPRATCQGFKYAVFEQFVLSRADILYKTASMFSTLSYIIRGEDAVVYRFSKTKDDYRPFLLHPQFPNKTFPILI